MKVIWLLLLLASFLCTSFNPPTAAQVRLQLVTTGLASPVLITHARDFRIFIAEQPGTVRIFYGGALLPTPFLDITTLTSSSGERGLLGLAFHPNYPAVPYVFAHFTSNGTTLPDGTTASLGDNLIVRYTVSASNSNAVDPESAKVLMRIPNPFSNHNGGMIAFGPDGYLHIAKGDGGSGNDPGNRAQNINELLGKILRVDVNGNMNVPPYYSIPPTNPFALGPGRDEIFLLGLRNPWRFSFDRLTGDLWIGDVGQGSTEEIDQLPMNSAAPGSNFGWRIYEGTDCTGLDPCVPPANYVPPVFTYSSGGGAPQCSVTGGYVYRGSQVPAISGHYIYADYCTGEIWSLHGGTNIRLLDSDQRISSFGENWGGELYVAGHGSGNVYKVLPDPLPKALILGKVSRQSGRGLSNVRVTRRSVATGQELTAWTNTFGYYRFPANDLNEEYIISVVAREASTQPSPKRFTLTDNFYGVDFQLVTN